MKNQIPSEWQQAGGFAGQQDRVDSSGRGDGVRKRSLLVGALLVCFLTVGAAHVEILLRSSYVSGDASTVGAFVLLFFVVGVLNALLKIGARMGAAIVLALFACAIFLGYYWPLAEVDLRSPSELFCAILVVLALSNLYNVSRGRSLVLNRSELILVYFMLLVASAVCTLGLSGLMVPVLASPFYYASGDNQWAEKLFPLLGERRFVVDDGQENVAFFEGLGPDAAGAPIAAWVEPLFWWGVFVLALCVTVICLMVIVRRQWMEHERLPYPAAQVPMALINGEDRRRLINDFFRSGRMWCGCAIPLVLGSMQAARSYDPSLPLVELSWEFDFFGEILPCRFNFILLGFSYLINTQIAASIWIFHLLFKVESLLLPVMGLRSVQPAVYEGATTTFMASQGGGALLAMTVAGLWLSRQHLRTVARAALGRGTPRQDEDEIISYRAAVLGIVSGGAVMSGWLWSMGMPMLFAALLVVVGLLLFLGIARYVSETGLVLAASPVGAPSLVLQSTGSGLLGPSGIVGLTLVSVCMRTFLMTACATGLKLVGEMAPASRRQVSRALALALVIGVAAGVYMSVHLAYWYGGVNLHGNLYKSGPVALFNGIVNNADPSGPYWPGIGFMAAGAGTMLMLIWARIHVAWWTLHPLGFPLSMTLHAVWFNVFLAWLLKRLIFRYGGAAAYRLMQPFFLGLIAGQSLCVVLWVAIGTLTGQTQVALFRF